MRPDRLPIGAPLARHQLATEVRLCRERVVSPAAQSDVVDGGGAAERPGPLVVVLEHRRLAATLAPLVDMSTAALIMLPDRAGHSSAGPASAVCCWRVDAQGTGVVKSTSEAGVASA